MNENVDIKFGVHNAFLEYPSSGTFKIEIRKPSKKSVRRNNRNQQNEIKNKTKNKAKQKTKTNKEQKTPKKSHQSVNTTDLSMTNFITHRVHSSVAEL